jgi:hypothetical protein
VPLDILQLSPNRVRPVNRARDEALLAHLVESMTKDGWTQRPLLVEETSLGLSSPQYFAWTGSHRIEAAKRVKLPSIPCCVLQQAEANAAFEKAGYDLDSYSCWRDALGGGGRRQEWHRLEALKNAGLRDAAALLEQELTATDGHTW